MLDTELMWLAHLHCEYNSVLNDIGETGDIEVPAVAYL